jgi:DNA (cytosine-5)-methyltransferase 1
VAQRRRRVFVVGHLGDWRPAAAVLFERYSLSGNPAPSREKREDPAKCLTRGAGQRYDFETEDLIPAYGIPGNWIGRKPENGGNATEPMHDIAPCLTKADQHGVAQPIPFGVSEKPDVGHCLRSGASRADKHESTTYVAQPVAVGTDLYNLSITGDVAACMSTAGSTSSKTGPTVMQSMAVRRLTPVECERLQGFPDSYTDIKSKNKPTPDGPRYKALGNSMAVPVMAWIGQRIEQVEAICKQNK